MDFFSEQDQARRSTKILVVLFSIAVVILIVLTNILVAITLWLIDGQMAGNYQAYQNALDTMAYQQTTGFADYFTLRRFALITLAVTGVIACAILFKWIQLSGGGKRVAEQLGGSRIHPNTNNVEEKRILNVVEEMALASSMPVPSVYLLAEEIGINAFAAGTTPADAVIGVTQGCLDQFSREQLQGVIAHEFSHILNGDMRLNIRLIAILHGILFIGLIGELLLRGGAVRSYQSRKSSGGSQMAILGVALLVIGGLGRFFGNWIKSAVSRQREYLADASAVQFTRNPQGISDALKIIGGYLPSATVQSTSATEMSHLFFGQAVSHITSMFATHPPLEDRISRIEPNWDGHFIFRELRKASDTGGDSTETTLSDIHHNPLDAVIASAVVAAEMMPINTVESSAEQPLSLNSHAHEPFSAIAIIFNLFLSKDVDTSDRQFGFIEQSGFAGIVRQTQQLQMAVTSLDSSKRLSLIELTLPALKCISKEQYSVFCKTLLLLIRADRKFELFEWCLYQVLRHYLDPEFGKTKFSRPIHKTVNTVEQEFQLVLSLLAHYGSDDTEEKQRAFSRGANSAGFYTLSLLEEKQYSIDSFISAVNQLANCYPLLKPRLLKALRDCATHDKTINTDELEILSAIAAVMDCPIPLIADLQ
ncbi:MAG: M48 family metallopeptidase [Oceanicoccus sp.]